MKNLFRRKPKLNRSSVREGYDNLPIGLVFSYADGLPILVNSKMYALCLRLTGKELLLAEDLWRAVAEGDGLLPEVRRITPPGAPQPVLCIGGKAYYEFTRTELHAGKRDVIQIVAQDTTQLHALSEELAKSNEELRQYCARLRNYSKLVNDLCREEELLASRVRIHNELGQTLTATRRLLATGQEAEAESVLASWRRITDRLLWAVEPKKPALPIRYLTKAADALGMRLTIRGHMPASGSAAELIVTVGAEALTNAFRHAGAKELTVEVSESDTEYRVTYANDGAPPAGEITVGGGIDGLRRRVAAHGGTLELVSRPRFLLSIQFPKSEEASL